MPQGPALGRRASSGPVALGALVGFPVAVVPSPIPRAVAPVSTGWLLGARGGRPRTRLIVPAAGPCRRGGAGLAPHRTRSGSHYGFVPGGSLRLPSLAACAVVVGLVWTWSLTRPVSRTVRHLSGDPACAPGLFGVDANTSPCGSQDAMPGSRACVLVRAPLGRVWRSGLPGALWCASPFLLAVLSFFFVRLTPGWGCPWLRCFISFFVRHFFPRLPSCAPAVSGLLCFSAPRALDLCVFLLRVPLSRAFRCFQSRVPWTSALCGCPPPPLPSPLCFVFPFWLSYPFLLVSCGALSCRAVLCGVLSCVAPPRVVVPCAVLVRGVVWSSGPRRGFPAPPPPSCCPLGAVARPPCCGPLFVFCPGVRCFVFLLCRLPRGGRCLRRFVLVVPYCCVCAGWCCVPLPVVAGCVLLGVVVCCSSPLACFVGGAPAWPRGLLPCCVLRCVVRSALLCFVLCSVVLSCRVVPCRSALLSVLLRWRCLCPFPVSAVLCCAVWFVLSCAGLVCAVVLRCVWCCLPGRSVLWWCCPVAWRGVPWRRAEPCCPVALWCRAAGLCCVFSFAVGGPFAFPRCLVCWCCVLRRSAPCAVSCGAVLPCGAVLAGCAVQLSGLLVVVFLVILFCFATNPCWFSGPLKTLSKPKIEGFLTRKLDTTQLTHAGRQQYHNHCADLRVPTRPRRWWSCL